MSAWPRTLFQRNMLLSNLKSQSFSEDVAKTYQ